MPARSFAVPAALSAGLAVCLVLTAPAQDDKLPQAQDEKTAQAAADGADGGKLTPTDEGERAGQDVYPRRLPAGYGAVGLSREQKEQVYAIQAKYDDRIQELLDEIAAIKNKQDGEIRGVLTPYQLNYLKAWEAKREAEREAARKSEEEQAEKNAGGEDGA